MCVCVVVCTRTHLLVCLYIQLFVCEYIRARAHLCFCVWVGALSWGPSIRQQTAYLCSGRPFASQRRLNAMLLVRGEATNKTPPAVVTSHLSQWSFASLISEELPFTSTPFLFSVLSRVASRSLCPHEIKGEFLFNGKVWLTGRSVGDRDCV